MLLNVTLKRNAACVVALVVIIAPQTSSWILDGTRLLLQPIHLHDNGVTDRSMITVENNVAQGLENHL